MTFALGLKTMQAVMVPPTNIERWTLRSAPGGWLRVQLEPGKTSEYLCEFTRVVITGAKDGRTFFKITDGYRSVGQVASMSTPNADRFLGKKSPGGSATVSVKYRGKPEEARSDIRGDTRLQQWADLSFAGQTMTVTLNSLWGMGFTPIEAGTHAILAPDRSHANVSTQFYVDATPGMVGNDTWFPIGLRGSSQGSSRYIHVGHLSEGCVTAYELKKWTALYTYLISHRAPGSGGKRIGQLVVRK